MAHPSEITAMVVVLVVAVVSVLLGIVAARGVVRSGNRRLWFVAGAFGVFALKGILVAAALGTESIAHQNLELVSSLFDLVIVTLLVLPLLR